jgi:two-component system, NarL family, sensor kinase
MKKYFFLILCFFTGTFAFSQISFSIGDDTKYMDSIVNIVNTTKSDSLKCMHSFHLSKLYTMTKDFKKARYFLNIGMSLCDKFPFLKAESTYYNTLSIIEKGDSKGFVKSLLKTNEDLKKFNNRQAFALRVIVLQNYNIMLQNQGRESEGMQMLISEGIPLAIKSKNDELTCQIYKSIGVIMMNAEEREKADYYMNQAQFYIERAKKKSPTLSEAKIETLIMNAENLIELKKFKASKINIDKIKLILSKYPESNFNYTFAYVEGLYLEKQNQHEKAIEMYDKGIKMCKSIDDSFSLRRLQTAKYESLINLKKYTLAIPIIETLIKTDPYPDNRKYHFKALSKSFAETNDLKKAYFFSEKYIVINDSLNAAKIKDRIIALEAKFNKTENEKKINQLLAQKEKAQLVAKNNRLNILLLGLLASILLISIFIIWKYFKNQKKQKEIDFNQKIESLENKKNLDVSNALLQGEEIERKRLARDLHDGLGSMLSGLKLYYSGTQQINKNEFEQVNLQLDNSIKELRQIAQNLMPESLLKLGLIAALKDLCLRFSNDTTMIEFQEFGIQNTISESKQITIYRIIQELINNAMKYANASEILVNCSQNENTFLITVEDNGTGFDVKKANLFDGMGLKNIKNRVDFLKGELEIDSQPQTGTVFNIELNVFEEQKIVVNA